MVHAGRWRWEVGSDAIQWSPALARIYGLSPGESPAGLEGFLELVYPDDRQHTQQIVARALTEARDVEYRHRIIRRDGQVRMLRSLVHVDTDASGDVVRLSGACQDVTGDVEVSERLRRLQGLATAGSIASGLAHDLNNMVGALVLSASALVRARSEGDRASLVDQLEHIAARTSAIASRIQSAAVHARPAHSRIDVADQVARVAGLLRGVLSEAIDVEVDAPAGVGTVHMDATDFERVLWNLVINARDAQPDGGAIRITADRVMAVERSEAAPYIRVTVSDDGEGMDEETRTHVFDPFFTTKGNGTGLGLAVVMDIVQHAGGFVTVHSRVGGGTRVRIHLVAID
jgi:PAS domain S-box-containing protein